MGIYIKGMEMPDSCHVCVAGYGGCCFVAPPDSDGVCPDHGRADFCPIIPVPPHGRLIDADALKYQRAFEEDDLHDFVRRYAVDLAPTIIEADEP